MHGGRTMGKYSEAFVAFDVAKKKHAVTIAEGGRAGEVRFLGDVENSWLPIERTIKRLADRYDRLHVCFEAGPTGYGLYRQIQALGHDCMVVAPAMEAQRTGDAQVAIDATVMEGIEKSAWGEVNVVLNPSPEETAVARPLSARAATIVKRQSGWPFWRSPARRKDRGSCR